MTPAQAIQRFIHGEFSDAQQGSQLTHRRQFAASGQFALLDRMGQGIDDLLHLRCSVMKVNRRNGHHTVPKFAANFTGKVRAYIRGVYLPATARAP